MGCDYFKKTTNNEKRMQPSCQEGRYSKETHVSLLLSVRPLKQWTSRNGNFPRTLMLGKEKDFGGTEAWFQPERDFVSLMEISHGSNLCQTTLQTIMGETTP